jgi:hypothetical protein
MWQRTIDCLGVAVRVGASDDTAAEQLAAVVRSYADAPGAATIDYVLDGTSLVRDGVALSTHELPIDAVPAFEIDLYRRVLSVVDGVPLHAGAVVDGHGAAVIFAGPSGAGKSTLMRALLDRGFRYLSEECVLLAGDRRCRGLARALNIDDPSIAPPTGYRCDPYTIRYREGTFRLFHPPESVMWRDSARAAAVIAIGHAPDAVLDLERLSGGAGLHALWPAVFRHEPAILDRMQAAFADVPVYRLRTSTPGDALAQVLAVAEEVGLARP